MLPYHFKYYIIRSFLLECSRSYLVKLLLKSVFRSSNFTIVAVTKNQNHATMWGFVCVIVVFVFVVVFPPLNYRIRFKECFSFVVVVVIV